MQELAHWREQAFLLDADCGITEASGELERVNAVAVDDAVDVDVAGVALGGELRLHLLQRGAEDLVRLAPEHGSAHLTGGRADVARKQLLVLEVDADRQDELPSVEERADCYLDADHAPLQLERLDRVRQRALIVAKHLDDVLAVLLLADEEQPLVVLRLAARLDDVAIGVRRDVGDGLIERGEVLLRDDGDAGRFELLLAEAAVVLEAVAIG